MRYYRIAITNAQTGADVLPKSLGGLPICSLLPSGQVNPAALNVELDIIQHPYHTPDGSALVRIWGLGIDAIGSAFDLNNANISVYAGMSKGLPLANPSQARLLVQGAILQAFGNWVGTDQTLDLLIRPATGTYGAPLNYILNWQAGTPMATAVAGTLQGAFPSGFQFNINLSNRLVLNHDEYAYYQTMEQFASVMHEISLAIIKDSGYTGVTMSISGNTVTVTDQTKPTAAIVINPQDLIGQPTWIDPGTVQAKFVLRGDLDISNVITMPQTLVTNTAGSMTSLSGQQKSVTFSGNFIVQNIHHYGNFRQPDAASWNTTVDMIPQKGPVSGQ